MSFIHKSVVSKLGVHVVLFAFILLTTLLTGCGGSSGSAQFDTPGSLTFEKEVVSDGSAFDIADPDALIKVSSPAGTVTPGQKLKVQIWSGQRALAKLKNFAATAQAIDLVIAPNALGTKTLTIEMDGVGTDPRRTFITAFGPDGKRMPLPTAAGSTVTKVKVQLSAEMIAFLANTSATNNEPAKIQISLETVSLPASSETLPVESKLSRAYTAPQTRTTYSDKRRIAIVVHDLLSTPSDGVDMKDFLAKDKQTDKAASTSSKPFDAIDLFTYDWTASLQSSAQALASKIQSSYGDETKYEVHIFAHGIGGLVGRQAIEKIGSLKSVKTLYMFGTPNEGLSVHSANVIFVNFLPDAGTGFIPSASKLASSLADMTFGSEAINDLRSSNPPVGIQYFAVAGETTDYAPFGRNIGQPIHFGLLLEGSQKDDGLVSKQSALYVPPATVVSTARGHDKLFGTETTLYLPDVSGAGWILGANRKIKTLSAQFALESVVVGGAAKVELEALDIDDSKLDPEILFDPTGASKHLPLVWTVADSSVARVSSKDKLSAFIEGLKVGETTVRVSDPEGSASFTITVKVQEGNIVVLPNRPVLELGETKRFTMQMVVGEIPAGTYQRWTVQGDGTVNGAKTVDTFQGFVDYKAPNTAATDTIKVELYQPGGGPLGGSSDALLGRGSTTIRVGASFRIVPNGKVVPTGGFQQFSIEPIGTSSLPVGGSFRWTVSGGTLESATTTAPSVFYTAPSNQSDQTISVDVLKSDGTSAGTASSVILVRPGRMQFTVANKNAFMGGDIPNGNYNDPLIQAATGTVGPVDRVGLTFSVDELRENDENPALVIQLAMPTGSKLSAGQAFTWGPVNVAGRFVVIGLTNFDNSGTFTINTVTPNSDGTFTYTFSITVNALIDNTSTTEATILTGTGSFTIAY